MSYTRFGDDLPPPNGYDVKKCDLCVNTAYILQQTYDFATKMFECSSGTRRIHAEISPELNTIGKINGYTRSALRFGVHWPNISSNLKGGICKCIFLLQFVHASVDHPTLIISISLDMLWELVESYIPIIFILTGCHFYFPSTYNVGGKTIFKKKGKSLENHIFCDLKFLGVFVPVVALRNKMFASFGSPIAHDIMFLTTCILHRVFNFRSVETEPLARIQIRSRANRNKSNHPSWRLAIWIVSVPFLFFFWVKFRCLQSPSAHSQAWKNLRLEQNRNKHTHRTKTDAKWRS